MPDSIVSACNQLDGVQVLWISRYAAGGNLFLDLEAVEALTQSPNTARDEIVDLLPITFRADWAMRVRNTDAGPKVLHCTSAAPDLLVGDAAGSPGRTPSGWCCPRSGSTSTPCSWPARRSTTSTR